MIDEKKLIERLEDEKSDWNDDYNVPINKAIKIVYQLAEEYKAEREKVIGDLQNGEWVDTDDVEKYLGIDFKLGMKLFDFSRTAEWNPPPLNGQKITTKFRLKGNNNCSIDTLTDLAIVQSLPSLYPLQPFEVEALHRVIEYAKYNNGWIPCSKELPPQPKGNVIFENKSLDLYLVSLKNTDYPLRAFWNGKYFTDGWSKLEVVAWRELPQPYQPKGEA